MPRKRLTDEEDFDAYIANWETVEREFFKLEMLQRYEEPAALKEYQEGKIEQARRLMRENLLNDPASPYEKIERRGIRFRRVHVVELPLTPYLHFEIESYKISTELGEQIFFVLKEVADRLRMPVKLQDFLLFDDKKVMIQYHDEDKGRWLYSELIDDAREVADYVLVKEQLLSKAIPMGEFLEKYQRQGKND